MMHDELLEDLKTKSRDSWHVSLLLYDFINEKKLYDNGMVEQAYWDNYLTEITGRLKQLEKDAYESNEAVASRRIFISYSWKDREMAEKIYNYLRNYKVNTFWDVISMEAGEEIENRLELEIQSAEFFLIIVSENSLRSSWVNKEAMMARMNIENGLGSRIIPIVIEERFYDNDDSLVKDILDYFDEKISRQSRWMKERIDKDSGEDIFQSQRAEYKLQRDNFWKIMKTLKERATVRLTDGHFESGMQRIIHIFNK